MERLSNYIPSFDELYDKVCEFVGNHQAEKGFINTQADDCDTIYGIEYLNNGTAEEITIHFVRVQGNSLQVITHPLSESYELRIEEDEIGEEEWCSVKYSDIYYVPTLLNIAECIEEYV